MGAANPKATKCRTVNRTTVAMFLLFLLFLAGYSVLFVSVRSGDYGRPPEWKRNSTELRAARDDALNGLIGALREATRLAADGEEEGAWFTAEARERWSAENPCASRAEMREKYRQRARVPYVEPNPRWREVLQEYAKLHRTCIHKVGGDATAYFLSKNASANCKFVVVDTEEAAGLGNRLVMIASAFTYALLTQRVVLVAREILPRDVLCEPFEGSSWRAFDPQYLATPFRMGNTHFNKSAQFHGRIDAARREGDAIVRDFAVANGEGWYTEQVDSRFFCDTEQEYYRAVPWVYIMGCLYFVPKLYAVPSFRPALDALFPDRAALTNVLRDVLPPADPVWSRVNAIEQAHELRRAHHRLGIQVRYRYKLEQFEKIHRDVENRVLQCGVSHGLLPAAAHPDPNPDPDPAPSLLPHTSNRTVRTTSVFVASLFEGVKNNLSATFAQLPIASGERVQVVQLSHEGEQKYGVAIFQDALAEIVTLSFSDSLFVTPQSTFSGAAQGYGGLVPWFIEFREQEPGQAPRAPCTRGQSVDVCFQVPYDYTFRCAYDAVNGYEISHVFPDIQRCLDADTPGLQLITDTSIFTPA